ncbi:MAG: hypothetical protein ACYCVL_00355 [Gemmatimonadaceae bacterium]
MTAGLLFAHYPANCAERTFLHDHFVAWYVVDALGDGFGSTRSHRVTT